MRFPSIGLTELVILAGIAGLAMLVGTAITVAIVRGRKTGSPCPHKGRQSDPFPHKGKRSGAHPWKWIVLFGLILVMLPLLVVALGILWVTPVRVERSYVGVAPTVRMVSAEPTATLELTPTTSGLSLTGTPPGDASRPDPTPVRNTPPISLSIVPDSALEAFAIPPLIAGLMVLIGAGLVALFLKRWSGDEEDDRGPKSRVVLLALALWIALSLFLILDLGLGLTVSIYPRFVAAYAAFWVLVGALLLHYRPMREKVLILVLFVVVVLSVRFIDWNSRKPFLRDLYSIREGMTSSQVEEIMDGYMKGEGRPLDSPDTESDGRGQIVTGTVTYRHTDEGWGDSDWGVVTFEDERVVEVRFLHD